MNIEEQIGCGYCANEKTCFIRGKYIYSENRKAGGTAELAANCGKFEHFNKNEHGK